ncbi:MAG TPA: hypothetical protein P5511_09815, partial [Candidatus Goldiibacteriota bacterium]|nr:hypothetical protein [Candidatus Goldiibacteriota bacterium]
QKQNQEKNLKGYFGKQQQRQRQSAAEPDLFNMSPQEIMQYMQRRMEDPFMEEPQPGRGSGNEKDW